ncbi:hypothetical protein [Streptomyces sp. NPDC004266]|uniref:hypothetical protein n=1 Tax=Streptomyces sp. NPDC004266 TaxID=3364693 RepID=UPI0036C6631D
MTRDESGESTETAPADLLLEAVLAQSAGECCVRLRPAPDGPSRDRAGADGRPPRRDS